MREPEIWSCAGREFAVEELRLIREVVESCSGLSRAELAQTICELLDWRRPHVFETVVVCDDGDLCTADACNSDTGACEHTDLVCDDGLACTVDSCDLDTGGCDFTPVVCDDEFLCTTDACDATTGDCHFTPVVCDDENSCTDDSCVTATGGCLHTPVPGC